MKVLKRGQNLSLLYKFDSNSASVCCVYQQYPIEIDTVQWV